MTAIPRWLNPAQGRTPNPTVDKVCQLFWKLANDLRHDVYAGAGLSIPDSEWDEGMRKLLEAKDCFVRCAVAGTEGYKPSPPLGKDE